MSGKIAVKSLSVAVGAAFITSLAGVSVAVAAENPFGMTQLSSGYMVADSAEGKCGAQKKTTEETQADGEKKVMEEGKCGEGKCGAKRQAHEGKCGAEKKPMEEGKCGAGK
jgi:uncharacterized low-complexity protein